MSDFFSIFQPGLAHFKRWKDAEKVLFVDAKKAGSGRQPDDLDSGSLTIEVPGVPGTEDGPEGRSEEEPGPR